MKDNISKKINDVELIEYIYQLKISKCIKENKLDSKQFIRKIERIIDTRESIIKTISK